MFFTLSQFGRTARQGQRAGDRCGGPFLQTSDAQEAVLATAVEFCGLCRVTAEGKNADSYSFSLPDEIA
jgi:hypothetical protein